MTCSAGAVQWNCVSNKNVFLVVNNPDHSVIMVCVCVCVCVLFAGVGASPGHVQCLRAAFAAVRGGFQTGCAKTQSCRPQTGGRTGRRAQNRAWTRPGAVAELACGGRRVLLAQVPAAVEWAAGGTADTDTPSHSSHLVLLCNVNVYLSLVTQPCSSLGYSLPAARLSGDVNTAPGWTY